MESRISVPRVRRDLVWLVHRVIRRCYADASFVPVSVYFDLSLFPFLLMLAGLLGWYRPPGAANHAGGVSLRFGTLTGFIVIMVWIYVADLSLLIAEMDKTVTQFKTHPAGA